MLSVLKYYGSQPAQVAYSHYEISNEVFMSNIQGKTFRCQRLHNVTQVRSSRTLAVTSQQIVEMAVNPFKTGYGTVLVVHNLEGLAKIKFKKASAGLLTLTFSSGHVLQYIMVDPIIFVDYLKVKMGEIGIKGDLTKNPVHAKHIETANSFFSATREIEAQFSLNPSYRLIEKTMDLLREAAEQFAEGSDNRYSSVIEHIQKFLQRADVTLILDTAMKDQLKPSQLGVKDNQSGVENDAVVSGKDSKMIPSSEYSGQLSPSNLGFDISKQDLKCDVNFSKYEDELAALMETPQNQSPRYDDGDEDDTASIKSDGMEFELKEMLGDITEEFTTLLDSFQKTDTPLKAENSEYVNTKSDDERDIMFSATMDFEADFASIS